MHTPSRLRVSKKIHDIHNDYPLAPEKINIPKEWLSKYCFTIASVYNITTGTVKKLVPNLMNKLCDSLQKQATISRVRNEIKENNRILKFKLSDWMRPYVDLKKERYQIMNLIRISLS